MDYFLGEIRLFPFGIIPRGWAPCNGQLLSVQSNAALFALLGSRFGGDGSTTFGLPDLRGRVAVGTNQVTQVGMQAGSESNTLTANELPPHTHSITVSVASANNSAPDGAFFGVSLLNSGVTGGATYVAAGSPTQTALHPATISSAFPNTPAENRQPTLGMNYCISLSGVYPPHQ
jgi:microcystin-dependent protein